MTEISWAVTCAVFFDRISVLGPKCGTSVCMEPARHRVHWPTGPVLACVGCAARWREIADVGLGMHLVIERLHYTPVDEDPAVQRFRAMELE